MPLALIILGQVMEGSLCSNYQRIALKAKMIADDITFSIRFGGNH